MQNQNPDYPGELTDENIRHIFRDANDFMARCLHCSGQVLYAYAIDGLIASAYASDYIFKPITRHLQGEDMAALYDHAMSGMIYNNVAVPCQDLDTVAKLLVNGFCVVLFPGVGAIGFEVKTPDKRGTSAPEVENTVKGAKDAFVETIRSNTSYIRRHLRSPDLRLYETTVGRRSLTNVSVIWLEGITNPDLVTAMKARLDSIDIDGFLSPSAVEEYITGSRTTAFPLLQYTERTDRFCQGILDGRGSGGRSAFGLSGTGGYRQPDGKPGGQKHGLHFCLLHPCAAVWGFAAESVAAGTVYCHDHLPP